VSALAFREEPLAAAAPRFEAVDCNLCGGSVHDEILDAGANGRIVRCPTCSLSFVSPRPIDVSAIYEAAEYFDGDDGASTHGYGRYEDDGAALAPYFDRMAAALAQRQPGRRLLEAGCATGFFLERAREHGFDVVGIDPSPTATAVARQALNVEVLTGSIDDARLEPASFDAIALFQTIEHVPDPAATVRQLFELLRPGGTLLMTTPDERSWLAKVLGKRWINYKPPEHLFYFNAATMRTLLERAGYTNIEIGRDIHRYTPGWLVRRVGYYFPLFAPAVRLVDRLTPARLLDRRAIPVHWGSLAVWAERPPDVPS
jgi:SAM-dependent methyltransferase